MEIKIRVHTTINLFDSTQKHSVAIDPIVNRKVCTTWYVKAKHSRQLPAPFPPTLYGQHTIRRHQFVSTWWIDEPGTCNARHKRSCVDCNTKKKWASSGGKNQIAIKKYNKIILSEIRASIAISGRQKPGMCRLLLLRLPRTLSIFHSCNMESAISPNGHVAPHEMTVAGNIPSQHHNNNETITMANRHEPNCVRMNKIVNNTRIATNITKYLFFVTIIWCEKWNVWCAVPIVVPISSSPHPHRHTFARTHRPCRRCVARAEMVGRARNSSIGQSENISCACQSVRATFFYFVSLPHSRSRIAGLILFVFISILLLVLARCLVPTNVSAQSNGRLLFCSCHHLSFAISHKSNRMEKTHFPTQTHTGLSGRIESQNDIWWAWDKQRTWESGKNDKNRKKKKQTAKILHKVRKLLLVVPSRSGNLLLNQLSVEISQDASKRMNQ